MVAAAAVGNDLHAGESEVNVWGSRGEEFFTCFHPEHGVLKCKHCISKWHGGLLALAG